MFRANDSHLQWGLFDTFQELPDKLRRRLETSWADTFYREVFCRIDEAPFAVLYVAEPSRPNSSINILMGAEILKAGRGWSDEELFDAIQFNLQVRYALGLRDMTTVPFELRTVYNFRQRLSQHMQETGENLLEQVFVQVTDQQLAALNLKTGQQRMDSVQVASNLRQMSRLHLLVEVVQRVWRMLSEPDQGYCAESFEPYRQGTAGQYCYRLKSDEVPAHLEAIGHLMHRLVRELEACYACQPAYQVLQRVFDEHFATVEATGEGPGSGQIRAKVGEELSAKSLQSPDDWEATYREKHGQGHRGYVANLTETCDPKNEVQLITQVQVAANTKDDEQMAVEAVPGLKARTDLEAFLWETDEAGTPLAVKCPGGQRVEVKAGRKGGRFLADFEATRCATCAQRDQCPTKPLIRRAKRVLRARARAVQVAQLRQRAARTRGRGNNRRAAIESTVRSVTHPFGGQAGKLPVRDQVRVTQTLIYSALMVNVRRIWRHEQQLAQKKSQELASLLSLRCFRLRTWFHRLKLHSSHDSVPALT